jgi:Fe-S oxidoreductase
MPENVPKSIAHSKTQKALVRGVLSRQSSKAHISRRSVHFMFIFGEKDRSSDLSDKGRGETHERREVEGNARVRVWVLQGKG